MTEYNHAIKNKVIQLPDFQKIQIKQVFLPLLIGNTVLCILDASMYWIVRLFGENNDVLKVIAHIFSVGAEASLPTWFASVKWAVIAFISIIIAILVGRKIGRKSWFTLGIIALFASIDEVAQLHEKLHLLSDAILKGYLEEGMVITNFTWVFPGVIVAIAISFLLLRFILQLPKPQKRSILIAGAIFCLGAIGFEIISGVWSVDAGFGAAYTAMVIVEEFLELTAVSLALATLVSMIEYRQTSCSINVRISRDIMDMK